MQDKQIELLVQRFLDGDTSLEEEKWLYDYFSRHEHVGETLLPYAEYFRDLATIPSPMKEEKAKTKRPWMRVWVRAAVGVAASAVLALAGVWGYTLHEEHRLAQVYGGSFVIVDGQRNDNLLEIKDSIQQTLAEARRIERKVEENNVINQAEQEVLESVGDPAQRREIEEILRD